MSSETNAACVFAAPGGTETTRLENGRLQDRIDNLTGALTTLAGLIRHRPERAETIRAAVLNSVGEHEHTLLRQLATDPHPQP